MIQDVWCLTRKNYNHRLMKTNLSEKNFNKDALIEEKQTIVPRTTNTDGI